MRSRQLAVVGVVMAALAASCATTEQGDAGSVTEGDDLESVEEAPHPGPVAPEDGPFDADAEIRLDLMEIHPDEASPGDHVELHYPQETSRGVGFVLEERVEDGWEVRYFLTVSDREDPEDPGGSWLPPDNPDRDEWPDIGVEGPGPGFALIPEPASPGDYRICTAMQPDSFCAELTITR